MELLRAARDRAASFSFLHPWWSLAALLAVTVAAAAQLPKLTTESDMLSFMPRQDPAYHDTLALEDLFGSTQIARILITRDDHPDGVFNPVTLQLVDEITTWLESRPEYETDRNADLRSLATLNDIRADANGMMVEPFMASPPQDREGAMAIRAALEANTAYSGVLASKDGRAISIVVRESAEGARNRVGYVLGLLDYLDSLKAAGHPEVIYASGRPVMEALFSHYIPRESARTGPYVLLMLSAFLFLSFRTVRGVIIPLAVIACTEAWMFGFLAAWGRPVYTVTSILPVLIMAIAVADSIHLISQYYEVQAREHGLDKTGVLRRTVEQMHGPVLMTSLTTAAGFLTMLTSPIRPLSDFGVIASVGVGAAYIITVIGVPALLALLPLQPPHWRHGPDEAHRSGALNSLLLATASCARRPRTTIGVFVVSFAFAATGLLRLTTNSSQVSQFRPGHFMRTADDIDNSRFSGALVLDLLIDAGDNDGIKEPELLRQIDAFQSEMQKLELVGDTFSIAELVKRMNRVMNEDRAEAEVVPAAKELVAQYLLLYSISGDPGDFDDIVDYDYRKGHIPVFVRKSDTTAARAVVAHARKVAARLFPDGPTGPRVVLAGPALIHARLERYVVNSQIHSLLTCLPVLFLMMWALFGRPALAALCIVPVSLAVVGIYGAMGYIGLSTDIGTAMLGGMTLGIGIDFAIHYTHRYLHCAKGGLDSDAAAVETALTAGRAIFYNAIVLVGGFLILLGARLYPQVKLGALVAATMVLCFLGTMLLFPAVLGFIRPAPLDPALDLGQPGAPTSRR
jgi:predicted RND superfamily exporter protein